MLEFVVIIIIFLFSAVLHEVSHGWAAYKMGDQTAKNTGRPSLNPLKHLDPVGSILLPLMLIIFKSGVIFGWAKPVPINPFNMRGKYAEAKTAIAGPLANIAVAIVFGLVIRFLPLGQSYFSANLEFVFAYIVWINLLLAVFNLVPIPPLDGSHILFAILPRSFEGLKITLTQYGFFILIFFIFFLFQYLIPFINFLFSLIVGQPFI